MAAKKEKCQLHKANGLEAWCTRDECIYWRLIDAQDEGISNREACGLQHFGILERLEPDMAEWLLQVKKQLESSDPVTEKSRITFRRREM
ncbi:MAG: hypothetical protein C4534_04690 [Gaiellales bacterium]|nr:MAG: hypothetical protein C4534_04690 [Gaiellales bacterium]